MLRDENDENESLPPNYTDLQNPSKPPSGGNNDKASDNSQSSNPNIISDLNELFPAGSDPSTPGTKTMFDEIQDNDLSMAIEQSLRAESNPNDNSNFAHTNNQDDANGFSFPSLPPSLPPRRYDFSNSRCFKTSDRIFDDLRNDPFFFLSALKEFRDQSFNPGILNSETVEYAERLHGFINSTPKRYQLLTFTTSLTYLNFDNVEHLGNGIHLWTINGLIVPKGGVGKLPKEPIFHFRIKIKGTQSSVVGATDKHQFYGFDDDQLFSDDREDLILSKNKIKNELLNNPYNFDEHQLRVIEESIPIIIDSANFVSETTGCILRVEVSPSRFDIKDWNDFSQEELDARYATYLSMLPENIDQNILPRTTTTFEALHVLFRVLKGPIEDANAENVKTLKPNNSAVLQLNLNLDLLPKKLLFRYTNDAELEPPQFKRLGKYAGLALEYFIKALLEVTYVSSLFSQNPKEFFKIQIQKMFSLEHVFKLLREKDVNQQVTHFDKWTTNSYATGLTTLSVSLHYPDRWIIDNYKTMTRLNPDNSPEYFDALQYCTTSRNAGSDLQIFLTTLRSQGVIGFQDLKRQYELFGLDITDPNIAQSLTDDQIIINYQSCVAVSQSKYQRSTFREALTKIGKYRESPAIKSYLQTEPYFDINDAYEQLEIDPSVDDDIVITAYQLKLEDNYSSPNPGRALATVARFRKSMTLINYIDSNLPDFTSKNITLEDAYKTMGCEPYTDDSFIIRIFQERVNKELNVNFQELWKCLSIIGQSKKSKLIEGFLTSGIVDSSLLSADKSPAGLNNIGNTCYLNSLLQYYFVITPLRNQILEASAKRINQKQFKENDKYSIRRIGGRTVGYKEVERSYQFMYQLKDLYDRLIHENKKCVTPTKELAYLAFSPSSDEVEFDYGVSSSALCPVTSANKGEVTELDHDNDHSMMTSDNDDVEVPSARPGNSIELDSDVELRDASPLPLHDLVSISITEDQHLEDIFDEEKDLIPIPTKKPNSNDDDFEDAVMTQDDDEPKIMNKEPQDTGSTLVRKATTSSGEPTPCSTYSEQDVPPLEEDKSEDNNSVIDLTAGDDHDISTPSILSTEATQPITTGVPESLLESSKSVAVAKISPDQMENAIEIGRQQDVTECISNVLAQIESALEPNELEADNEQVDLVKKLFYGKTKQMLTPVDSKTKEVIEGKESRTKEERFLNLIVNIGDHPKDIYDALDTYFTEDLLNLDDGEVKRSLTITELPNILQIQIQRVQFDRVRLIPVKSIEPLPFEEQLYMDRYMETDDQELIDKRTEVFHWRRRIDDLTKRKALLLSKNEDGLNIKEVLQSTKEYLQSEIMSEMGVLVDTNTIDVLNNQIERITSELKRITDEITQLSNKISLQFSNFNNIGYTIFAIFIHRGQASYGHYWIYIRDPKSNLYRKYNDEIVSEVSLEEVLNFNENNNATPYYLAFVKNELLDHIEPLKREIVENFIEELN